MLVDKGATCSLLKAGLDTLQNNQVIEERKCSHKCSKLEPRFCFLILKYKIDELVAPPSTRKKKGATTKENGGEGAPTKKN